MQNKNHKHNEILLTEKNNIATISINRPKVKNAFDSNLINSLLKTLKNINENKNIKLVILTGEGNCFSSGADLNWMQKSVNFSEQENYNDALQLAELLETLNSLKKPTIALVKGFAYGGAIGLIACCDIVICENNTKFCLSEVKIGLSPAVISPYVIAKIGENNARRYMITAETFSSSQALSIGLVTLSGNEQEIDTILQNIIKKILNNAPNAIATTKSLILQLSKISQLNNNKFNTSNSKQNINLKEFTANIIAKLRTSQEGQEGVKAFLEKRKPDWQNY